MMHFLSNPCEHPYCMYEECGDCRAFKPRVFGIPVPRKFGAFLFIRQEKRFFKKWLKEHPNCGTNEGVEF